MRAREPRHDGRLLVVGCDPAGVRSGGLALRRTRLVRVRDGFGRLDTGEIDGSSWTI
jgi:hypothetical protein